MKFKGLCRWHSRLPSHPPSLQKPHVCRRTAFRSPCVRVTRRRSAVLQRAILAENRREQQLRCAGGLSGKRRACQTGTAALTVSTTVQQAAQTRAGELQTSFSHTSERRIVLHRADRGRCFLHPCRREHRLWSEHTGGCCPVVDELVRPPREHSQQQLHHHRHRLYRCERNRILGAAFHCINAKQTAFAVCLGLSRNYSFADKQERTIGRSLSSKSSHTETFFLLRYKIEIHAPGFYEFAKQIYLTCAAARYDKIGSILTFLTS